MIPWKGYQIYFIEIGKIQGYEWALIGHLGTKQLVSLSSILSAQIDRKWELPVAEHSSTNKVET